MSKPDKPHTELPGEVREQRLAAVGELMAGLSHEARNILSGILSFAQVGKLRTEDPEKMAVILTSIEDEALRCIDLFSAALGHAQIHDEADAPQESSLVDAIHSSSRLIQHQLGMRKVHLTMSEVPSTRVCIDAGALRQIVLNLLINAMQATPDGGDIRISVTLSDQHACLAVEDSGPGIAPELRESIFERRYTTKANGSGYGLAISRSLANAANGSLLADESTLGGARFLLRLCTTRESSDG